MMRVFFGFVVLGRWAWFERHSYQNLWWLRCEADRICSQDYGCFDGIPNLWRPTRPGGFGIVVECGSCWGVCQGLETWHENDWVSEILPLICSYNEETAPFFLVLANESSVQGVWSRLCCLKLPFETTLNFQTCLGWDMLVPRRDSRIPVKLLPGNLGSWPHTSWTTTWRKGDVEKSWQSDFAAHLGRWVSIPESCSRH